MSHYEYSVTKGKLKEFYVLLESAFFEIFGEEKFEDISFGCKFYLIFDNEYTDMQPVLLDRVEQEISVNDFNVWEKSELEFADRLPRCEDGSCVGRFGCEGKLYELVYGYGAYGRGGERGKMLYDALEELTSKYGMFFEWDDGAINFSDKLVAEQIRKSFMNSEDE